MKPPNKVEHLLFGGTFVLANKLQAVFDRIGLGLSTKQWFLLRNMADLQAEPPPTISQIAQAMDSTRQNVAKMLGVMEREGLVVVEESKTDRRSYAVRVTETGKARAKQADISAQALISRLYEDIRPEDLATAGRVLVSMVENLNKIQEELS